MKTSRRFPLLVGLLAAAAAPPSALRAQSAQALSVQVSGLYANVFGDAYEGFKSGIGAEAQLRYTHTSGWSFGAGYQRTWHELDFDEPDLDQDVTLSGPFIEPRYTFVLANNERIFPYLSGRLSLLKQSVRVRDDAETFDISGSATGLTANLGGGLLSRLSSNVNLDVGVTYGYTNFEDFTLRERFSGETLTGPSGSGSNLIARVGLAIGLR